jgi:hypothetical protein
MEPETPPSGAPWVEGIAARAARVSARSRVFFGPFVFGRSRLPVDNIPNNM